MRYDLTFMLCCCKSFLGSPNDSEEDDYYTLLGIARDATADELKRAYKRQSLQMHPDKLAQRGLEVTPADQAKFTRMKEAYEVLSDPHKRETYDAVGERGLKWLDEPMSMDPQELAHNFATSSVYDRSKIFAIFVGVAVALLALPVLICWHVDGVTHASWMATLTPLWLWDVVIAVYHVRVILLGPIPKPDHVPPDEWVDPLPMRKRYLSLGRFLLLVVFEVLAALRLDEVITWPWAILLLPLLVWEATTIYKKYPLARMRIVTVADLEVALGKPFADFTPDEKELIAARYSVVPSTDSPDFDLAQKIKTRARHDLVKAAFRLVFGLVVWLQLDNLVDWNWWWAFLPFWLLTALICYANWQAFAEVQQSVLAKDPTLLGEVGGAADPELGGTDYGAMKDNTTTAADGTPTTTTPPPITPQEREELKAQLLASSTRLCGKCCVQGLLVILVALFVSKLQGATFSSLWILSPFLLVAGIVLCCLGCAIFGMTEVPTDGIQFDSANDWNYTAAPGGDEAPVYTAPAPPVATAEPVISLPPSTIVSPPPPTMEKSQDELD